MGLHQIKNFCKAKETSNILNSLKNKKKIFAGYLSERGLISVETIFSVTQMQPWKEEHSPGNKCCHGSSTTFEEQPWKHRT
jgi:hypothetical protein